VKLVEPFIFKVQLVHFDF